MEVICQNWRKLPGLDLNNQFINSMPSIHACCIVFIILFLVFLIFHNFQSNSVGFMVFVLFCKVCPVSYVSQAIQLYSSIFPFNVAVMPSRMRFPTFFWHQHPRWNCKLCGDKTGTATTLRKQDSFDQKKGQRLSPNTLEARLSMEIYPTYKKTSTLSKTSCGGVHWLSQICRRNWRRKCSKKLPKAVESCQLLINQYPPIYSAQHWPRVPFVHTIWKCRTTCFTYYSINGLKWRVKVLSLLFVTGEVTQSWLHFFFSPSVRPNLECEAEEWEEVAEMELLTKDEEDQTRERWD